MWYKRSMDPKIDMDSRTISRMAEVMEQIGPMLNRGRLSPCNLVGLLLDHWKHSPPDRQWVVGQANLYPGHGGSKWPMGWR